MNVACGAAAARTPAQLEDLGQQEADVDRLVGRRLQAVDDDAVVDDADAEADHVRPEALGSGARRAQRVLRDQVGIEQLDLGAGRLDRRAQALEAVRRHRRHPLERVRVDEEDAGRAGPGDDRPGWGGHCLLECTGWRHFSRKITLRPTLD